MLRIDSPTDQRGTTDGHKSSWGSYTSDKEQKKERREALSTNFFIPIQISLNNTIWTKRPPPCHNRCWTDKLPMFMNVVFAKREEEEREYLIFIMYIYI